MESESSADGSFPLLPPKRMKIIDWSKCLICQTSTSSDVRKAGEVGIAQFVSAAKHRNDATYERLEHVIEELHTRETVWHRACYQTYTIARTI
jgi:hypothetical protein